MMAKPRNRPQGRARGARRLFFRRAVLCAAAAAGLATACHRSGTPPAKAAGRPLSDSPAPSLARATASPKDGDPSRQGGPSSPPDFAVDAVSSRDGEATWYEVPEGSLPERRAWPGEMTAASDILPLNSYARVRSLEEGGPAKNVIVRITDTGVHRKGTLVDLDKPAAEALGFVKTGRVRVRVELLALKNATADKPVPPRNAPEQPKLDQPAATREDEKEAARAKAPPTP